METIPKFKQGSCTFELFIPKEVEAKIRYLCNRVNQVEWSGILFYEHTGSFDEGNLKLCCKDIFLKDIGSSTYTEFDDNPDVLDYRINNDLLRENIQEGLIHSHNTFSAFFSGTDIQTLKEEGNAHNHFLSLIVNNEGKYVARITRKITTNAEINAHLNYKEDEYYNTFGNSKIILKENTEREENNISNITNTLVEWFELDINKEESRSQTFEDISQRIEEIKEQKKRTAWRPNNIKFDPFKPTKFYETPFKNYHNNDFYYDNDFYDDDFYESFHINNTEVSTESVVEILTPLLSGSIFNKSHNINRLVERADELYTKKFGDLSIECNLGKASNLIGVLLDYLLYGLTEESTEENIVYSSILIAKTIDCLKSIKIKSIIKDLIIDNLKLMMPYGITEYFTD